MHWLIIWIETDPKMHIKNYMRKSSVIEKDKPGQNSTPKQNALSRLWEDVFLIKLNASYHFWTKETIEILKLYFCFQCITIIKEISYDGDKIWAWY